MKTLATLLLAFVLLVAALLVFAWSGVYDVGADTPHTPTVHTLLEGFRERSIARRIEEIAVPDLDDPQLIRSGAGNYDAMCMGCHLAPGMSGTELSRGLYPAPPDLTRTPQDPARAFWIVKHGIKSTGMPAWGRSMQDEYLWGLVAFVRRLPAMTPAVYEAEVAASPGHAHGGGETSHPHQESDAPQLEPERPVHRHEDGKDHEH